MRVLMTSFAALFALIAFGPGETGVALGDDNAATIGAAAGAQAPALPPIPVPGSAPTLAPASPPAPAATFAPSPVLSPIPAARAQVEVGNPDVLPPPVAGTRAVVAVNPGGDQWRYRWHNNNWWYWTPANRWIYRSGDAWTNYEPAVTVVPEVRYSQPAYGYAPGPYRYSAGYGSYYGPAYRDRYYGQGGYYGRPRVSVGVGFGRGIRIGY